VPEPAADTVRSPTTKGVNTSWEVTAGHGGYLAVPDLAGHEHLEGMLSPRARKAWARAEALLAQHADLTGEARRVLDVEVPAAEAARHEHAVAAVRAGEPGEHTPTVAALKERAERLTVEAGAVVVVLTEALAELKQVLLDDQGRMAKLTFDTATAR
jgi:hypothetical protein